MYPLPAALPGLWVRAGLGTARTKPRSTRLVCGSLNSVSIVHGGTGYRDGDTVNVSGGNSEGQVTVNSTDSDFNALGQTHRDWEGMAAAPNGNVYAADSNDGDIYMQTGGVGDFVALGQPPETGLQWPLLPTVTSMRLNTMVTSTCKLVESETLSLWVKHLEHGMEWLLLPMAMFMRQYLMVTSTCKLVESETLSLWVKHLEHGMEWLLLPMVMSMLLCSVATFICKPVESEILSL